MNRWIVFSLILLVSVPAALADDTSPETLGVERAARLRENRNLIAALVHTGLRLADNSDPAKRTAESLPLLESLMNEIVVAGENSEPHRVIELSGYFLDLLDSITVHNAKKAKVLRDPRVSDSLAEANRITQSVIDQLRSLPGTDQSKEVERLVSALDRALSPAD